MKMSQPHLYIGPYFRVLSLPKKEEEQRRVCSSCKDSRELTSNFCPSCGSASVVRQFKIARHVHPYDALEEGERLCVLHPNQVPPKGPRKNSQYIYLAPNVDGPNVGHTSGIPEDFEEHPCLEDKGRDREKKAFEKFFRAEQKQLESVYGEGSVETRWGVFTYRY